MRVALALVVASAPAFAQVPDAPTPPPAETPPTGPQPAPAAGEPRVDPAYGERPQSTEPASSGEPGESPLPGYRRGHDIVVRYHPDRSRENITMLAILGGASVVVGAVGLYFHLDSRDATLQVESDRYTGETWTAERQDAYDRAHRSATVAGVTYGIGGALVLATAIAYIVTEPELETRVIRPHEHGKPQARAERSRSLQIGPTRGGAYVGGARSF